MSVESRPVRDSLRAVVFEFLLFVAIVALAAAALRMRWSVTALQQSVADLQKDVADLRRRLARAMTGPPDVERPAPEAPRAPAPAPPPVAAPAEPPARPQAPAPFTPPEAVKPLAVRVPKPPAPPEPPPPPKQPPIDWERWIGIRGAAVLGGVVLALAGLLFFQYSIQHGLITPPMRVVLGLGTGLFAIVASEWLRPRGYNAAAEALAGGGVVVLYAALWAGHTLYQLIPLTVCFALMVLVTATCGLLAVRHASQLVAVLGLIGGFATPLMLRSNSDHPIGLFGYVLLLDIGLLSVGRKKSWPSLSLLGLVGTLLLQWAWIGFRMGPDRLLLGLLILGVFAILFTAAGVLARGAGGDVTRLSQGGGLLLPFGFAVYFASRADLGPHLWPVAILLAILSACAAWVGRRQDARWMGVAAAAGSLGVFAVWIADVPLSTGIAWEAVGVAVGLACVFHVFVELDPDCPGFAGPAAAGILAGIGFFVLLVVFSARTPSVGPWVWVAGWLAFAALLYRHAAFPDRAALQVGAAFLAASGVTVQHLSHLTSSSFPPVGVFLSAAVSLAILGQVVALMRRRGVVREMADHAAAVFALTVSVFLVGSQILGGVGPAIAIGVPLLLGVCGLLAAARLGIGAWALAALGVTGFVNAYWVSSRPELPAGDARVALAMVLFGAVLFVVWPFAAGTRLRADRVAWYAAALAGPVAFVPSKRLWPTAVGGSSTGLLPILLGALALAAVVGGRRLSGETDETRKRVLVWFSAVAIAFLSIAIPLQLEKSWITIGWALEGLALIALWRRLDHPGLKWLALAHLAAAAARLAPTTELLNAYPRSSFRIVNWLLYTYLVPAAALFASAKLLAPDEVERARPWEEPVYANGKPWGSIGSAVGGIVVVFVWINVAIADWFAQGDRLTLQFGRSAARDLTVSILWVVYALVLLGFGMARVNIGLRWLSLSFLVVTIGKVFLYDLGQLHDLYRVMSLVGLAVSLLLVSLLYQRFVFRRSPSEPQ